jgi:phosphoglycerol transferase
VSRTNLLDASETERVDEQQADEDDPWRAGRAVPTRHLVAEAMVAGLASLGAACLSLQVWRGSLRVPFSSGGDGAFYLMLTRALERNGQYLTNPGLGYPTGQDLHDLPHGADNLNLLLLRVAAFTGEPGLALNLFYLAGFFLIGVTMQVALRRLGARRDVAIVVSVLFAVAPFHLLRSTGHVLLSAYYSVPLVVLLALAVLSDDPPLSRWRRWRPVISGRDAWVVVACIVVASAGAYYAFFGLLLIAVGGAVATASRRTWRPVASVAMQVSIIAVVFVANIAPSIAYWMREGANPRVARRYPSETETFGLRISQLVVPRPNHRLDLLARMAERSRGGPIDSELGQNLGLVVGAGFVLLLAIVAWRLVLRASATAWWTTGRGRVLLDAGFLTLCCLLTAAAGGFSYLLSSVGARDIRAWNRMSIVIAALACVAVALVASEVLDRLERSGRRRWGAVALALLLVVGLLDQTSPADSREREAHEMAWDVERAFFRDVAAELPAASPVFQLPVQQFPEEPAILGTDSYSEALAYVHAPELRWSFGAMKGRVPGPVPGFDLRPGTEMADALAAQGYRAVVVDRAGYADRGADLEARLAAATAPPSVVSADGRYSLFLLD